ncbi:MAG: phosphate ABC transporter permease subunit PstC [Zetaproteobacteria bacterium CG06_land_8_20_14_3_00_59_53]|nr:MAG: phosphate ABC transporter permease subunit PstC [Zetaproteobacteria bacterium CG2_30_59_37]PIO89393.1 MAG: phosphate ABC transporter permease subunit PstC [Zetaproteobacteria bacterium CG23_combo_of_CG06-09_8_20_14_all_59_86]PIQ65671.1 MAG: phosphate ABC transporter permease subunit PstC [Zetaproteobacteria bacterium CG11_big_fil_rev_8_21_14_0_20_59_439]PIU70688.1 MAG: phosphate ABC transporter permease subunit PstC [Zetaproteobacteria bacterium CG06_land_8_20_14_3_00_59_53]PIU98040.1 M
MNSGNVILWILGGLLPLCAIAFFLTRNRMTHREVAGLEVFSRPGYYGWLSVIYIAAPAIFVALCFSALGLLHLYQTPLPMFTVGILTAAALGLAASVRLINPEKNARLLVEKWARGLMIFAAGISIMTTIGILLSVLFESIRFFQSVPLWEFITGTRWEADTAFLAGAGRGEEGAAKPHFGAVPIFAGTFMITAIAMLVAIPIGLFSAIYLSEYAPKKVRATVKPMLEVLAGIPTVVYGFFAAITISPLVVQAAHAVGLEADYTNALAPGLVMGVMIIPFISSLSEDVIHAVPQAMRDGSLAMGIGKAETIRHVVLPAAMPGIIAASLLGMSRAIGETMIVVMAAGLRPNLTANPLEGMTTVTVKIVESLTGDQQFDSLLTLSAFALGLVLLFITLALNVISTLVIYRFKKQFALV